MRVIVSIIFTVVLSFMALSIVYEHSFKEVELDVVPLIIFTLTYLTLAASCAFMVIIDIKNKFEFGQNNNNMPFLSIVFILLCVWWVLKSFNCIMELL